MFWNVVGTAIAIAWACHPGWLEPNLHMQQQLDTSEDLRQIEEEWSRLWVADDPSHLSWDRIDGSLDESETVGIVVEQIMRQIKFWAAGHGFDAPPNESEPVSTAVATFSEIFPELRRLVQQEQTAADLRAIAEEWDRLCNPPVWFSLVPPPMSPR
jgi:hypothetical protein